MWQKGSSPLKLDRVPTLVVIANTPKGRGIFTTRKIAANTTIEVCPVLVLPSQDVQCVKDTLLNHYTYNWPVREATGDSIHQSQAVALGLGSLFNHSTFEPNVGWERNVDAQCITYRALHDIDAGEELCINYGRLWFVDTDANPDEAMKGDDEELLHNIQLDSNNFFFIQHGCENMKEQMAEAKPQRLVPISQPINVHSSETARLYAHVYPALLLSLLAAIYQFRFRELVDSTLWTLTWTAGPLALLQMLYCVVCLPPSSGSSSSAQPTPSKGLRKKRVQFAKPPATFASKIIPAIYSLFLSLLLATPILTVLLILFGAPLTTHMWHNLLTALHISFLAVLPLFYVHGVNSRMWREISAAALPFDEVWGASVGTLVGAWLGAIPIPLDWDRDWQKWPLTIITGAYVGWFLFRFAAEYLFRGKRIDFDDPQE